jgi:hypothetical protein
VTESKLKNPLDRTELINLYFLEHRAKLIDIAAFLDRLDRAGDAGKDKDFRIKAFRKAAEILTDESPDKAKRILEVFSDHTTDLPESAPQSKGALGAAREDVE